MPGKQFKTGKIEMDNNERGKKHPTLSPSSYTLSSRWMAKAGTESRPTSPTGTGAVTDENFPSLANSGDEVKKKRSVWNDSNTVKRKVISASLPGGEDPFAGMNTRVDYQQEIERLKALVPKVEKKPKMLTAAAVSLRPRSTASDPNKQSQRLWSDTAAREASTKTPSTAGFAADDELDMINTAIHDTATSSNSSPGSSNAPTVVTGTSTPVVDMSASSTDEDEEEVEQEEPEEDGRNPSGPVITEEEKLRFLEFMRSWTGCWQGWDRSTSTINSNSNSRSSIGSILVTRDSSLWAGRSPWEHEPTVAKRPEFSSAHLRHLRSDPPAYDPYLPFLHGRSLHPSVSTAIPNYYREDIYPQYDPQQVGTIGEKYRQPNTYRRENGYGVFVV